MSEKFILAIPSKGRLQEKSARIFADMGLPLLRDNQRGYKGRIDSLKSLDLVYLSASEIALALRDGSIHAGITGEDLIRESIHAAEDKIIFVEKLGFGQADVVVAVPDAWIDVTHMQDLVDVAAQFRSTQSQKRLRVATKFINLCRDYFIRHGLTDFKIIESFGATEGAPTAGAADVIVDITSTGATLRANDLRILEDGVILQSQANLMLSRRAVWDGTTRTVAQDIIMRLEAYLQAQNMILLTATPPENAAQPYRLPPQARQFEDELLLPVDSSLSQLRRQGWQFSSALFEQINRQLGGD